MKEMKKLFGIMVIVAIAAIAGWNFSQSQNKVEMSDLVFANIEALANPENEGVIITCGSKEGRCWKNTGDREYNWGPFGPVKVTVCPTFSGWQSDYCINGMPLGEW